MNISEMQTEISPTLEAQLVDAINQSTQNGIHSNAAFLAERLLAQKPCEEYRILLADCYINQRKPHKAYHILKEPKSEIARYKFAYSCNLINKYKQAEKALNPPETVMRNASSNPKQYAVPNGAYGHYLLGVVNEKLQKHQDAKVNYFKAVDLNPTLWTAYQKLIKLGEEVNPSKIYTPKTRPGDQSSYSNSRRRTSQTIQTGNSKKKGTKENETILSFLRKLAQPTYDLAMYRCDSAIAKYQELPESQLNTGWAQMQLGKANMELVRYKDAQKCFIEARKLEPFRIEGLESYSSCLWHLRKYADLIFLAHQACEKSIYNYETWITMGNCFSGLKEHEMALKFFGRAIQLNPTNATSYSLCGHEYVYTDDFAKAKKMFETALAYDIRHYNGWWGLGNIAYKQEKYGKAAQYFTKAAAINPQNPVVYTFLGMTASANKDFTQALYYYQKSQQLDDKNCLNRFQKANALVKLSKYNQAIKQLESLHHAMPKQAPVLTLLGLVYKKLNKIDTAHNYLSKALDLQCKDTQKIKGFIENLENREDDTDLQNF